jgi:peptide/nickel transport system permease protein
LSRALGLIGMRLAGALPTLLIVACGAFLLLELAPGDAVDAYLAQTGGDAGFAASLRRELGLGGSIFQRLFGFLIGLLSLDLGMSAVFSRPVISVIAERLPNTLLLMASTVMFAAGIGLALGVLAGARPLSPLDRGLSLAALIGLAIPNFWLGLLLIVAFVVSVPLLPVGGIRDLGGESGTWASALDIARHLVLPTIALGTGYVALYMRTLRAGMLEAWHAEHVRAARARGLQARAVLWRNVVRPALLPLMVVAGQNIGTLVGGSVVVETVFAIPGMGRLAFEAVNGRDTALLIGVVLCSTLVVLAINLTVDLLMSVLDPRIGVKDA